MRNRRMLMAGVMLVAFASRALIPPGFMPAGGRPFSFEVCWEDLPAGLLSHLESSHADSMAMDAMGMDSLGMDSMGMDSAPAGSMAGASIQDPRHRDSAVDIASHRGSPQASHHHGNPGRSEHCVFGTACGAGPIPHLPVPSDFSSNQPLLAAAFASIAAAVRVVHLPQARAPPVRPS